MNAEQLAEYQAIENQIKLYEDQSKALKGAVEIRDALNRLATNTDFVKIIDKGLFEEKAINLVLTKADPAAQTPEFQEEILRGIDAIGWLRQHFAAITNMGNNAEKAIAQNNVDIEEARAALLDIENEVEMED